MPRAFLIILDSVGIGGSPDAGDYGDAGADTIGHIAEACWNGDCDVNAIRSGPLQLQELDRLGLGHSCRLATGHAPPGLDTQTPQGCFGCASEISRGKDTPSGHWELAGVPVTFEWGYFPRTSPCFPQELTDELVRRAELPGILGNCHASGTEIIARLGGEHLKSGKPICYTSADSVFQIAAHEESFGLDRLYGVCQHARCLVDGLRICRVIARPFIGNSSSDFSRTGNRRDYSVLPPAPTLLNRASKASRDVATVGKIADIFAHSGTGRIFKAHGNEQIFDRTIEAASGLEDGGLLVTNFIDFDTLYGHRRDVTGYAAALERFDRRLPELLDILKPEDLLVITADHGCDPTWHGTDHTREQIPILTYARNLAPRSLGKFGSFSFVSDMLSTHLELPLAN